MLFIIEFAHLSFDCSFHGASPAMEDTVVTVCGLTEYVNKEDIAEAFADFGDVDCVLWCWDQHDKKTGAAYVIFKDAESAKKAIDAKKKGYWPINPLDIPVADITAMKSDQDTEEKMEAMLKTLSPAGKIRASRHFGDAREVKQEPVSPQLGSPAGLPSQLDSSTREKVPKLPSFSGSSSMKDASYARWQYQVRVLINQGYSEATINQAISQSIKSPAADILVNLGMADLKTSQILQKMKTRFGSVASTDTLREQLYSLKQGKEDITKWSFEVEEKVYLLHENGGITDEEIEGTTKSRFWHGLEDSRIKEATRHTYLKLTFDELLVECRRLEAEYSVTHPTAKSCQQSSSLEQKIDKLLSSFVHFENRLSKLESQQKSDTPRTQEAFTNKKDSVHCTKCKKTGHLWYSCRKDNPQIVCRKCKTPGHLANGCRNLNSQ